MTDLLNEVQQLRGLLQERDTQIAKHFASKNEPNRVGDRVLAEMHARLGIEY